MWEVTTQVSDPKIRTAFTTDSKNNPYTRSAAPSLMRIHVTLPQNAISQYKFFTTAGQSSSAAKITRTGYLKEVTISRGRP